jgi:hypothetical protein
MRWIIETRELPMNSTCWRALLGLFLFFGAAPNAMAQQDLDRTVEQYSCKDVLRESGASRDVAIAFLHGFLLGKSGTTKFNLDTLRAQTDQFVEACLDKSGAKAIDVMSSIKK